MDLVAERPKERQLRIPDFYTRVPFVYVPLRARRGRNPQRPDRLDRRGLAELRLKQRLEREGWTVWRGELINILRRDELYPNVRRKYANLQFLLRRYHPGTFELLEYLCAVHHGIPDFICFRRGECKFVECKLGHEQLNTNQKRCIPRLQHLGFRVEVHKLVAHCTQMRRAIVDITTGERQVLEKQLRLTKKLCAARLK